MRDNIFKILNDKIDEIEKKALNFINEINKNNNEIMIYFSKVLKFIY